ncbi:MAG: hypothetical protein HC796_08050 [Synechococcaceae cyanobacterium RL_1_2]|nr:hypothetical protein [Synechococcaceae cyanobacterium RL_1_2]
MNYSLLLFLTLMGTGSVLAPFAAQAVPLQSSSVEVLAESNLESEEQEQTVEITGQLKSSIYQQILRSEIGVKPVS